MIVVKDKKACYGCFACYNICPNNSISMVSDEEGFLYPRVNSEGCMNCGKCENHCPQQIYPKKELNEGWAIKNLDKDVRKSSSSGGVFYLLAEYIICQGGVVFGAFFNEDLEVLHGYAEKIVDCRKFQGSKYIQSYIGKSYAVAKDFLEKGKLVYFSGTPCQIYGLKMYLGKEYNNLICQDIACHGVASNILWKKYIAFLKRRYHSDLKAVNFRDKSSGWKQYSIKVNLKNGKEKRILAYDDLYIRAYLSKLYLRPSCYSCKVKGLERISDITLADFWGVEKLYPEMDDDLGTSLVLFHTLKGKKLIEKLKDKIESRPVDTQKAVLYNPAIYKSAELPQKREHFIESIKNERFEKIVEKYCGDSFVLKIKIRLFRLFEWMKKNDKEKV